MKPVVKFYNVEEVINEYHILIDNLRNLISDEGSGINIENTKIFKYKKKLDGLNSLDTKERCRLISLLNRYRSVNFLFEKNSIIEMPNKDILKLIEGSPVINDQNEGYNDAFFEVEMAVRFSKSLQNNNKQYKINMRGICDIIIDDKIAIECKYVHGKNRIREKISDGISQIKKRVSEGLASVGIVALDLSNIVDDERVLKFSQNLYSDFLKYYKDIMESRCFFAEKLNDHDLMEKVILSGYFKRIVTEYACHELDSVFYKSFTAKEKEKIDGNALAVVYQANFYMHFKNNEAEMPLPIRVMRYYIKEPMPAPDSQNVKHLLHSLAVGI